MQVKSWVTWITLLTFTVMVWPRGADAAEPQAAPPAPPPPGAAAAAPAAGEDAAMAGAKQHFEAGRNAYNANDFVTAIREFKQAEQLRPSPILDYNNGLANEKLGKRRVAVKYYRRYLEAQPNASNKAEVDERIRGLEASIAAQPGAGQPGNGPPEAVEQPSDMPPPDPNAQAGAVQQPQPGYDPYASQPPPGQPVAAKPKKRNLWWVWLIVAGGVAITATIIIVVAVAVVNATPTTPYYLHSSANERLIPPMDNKQAQPQMFPVLRF
jgi:tetratricopeptide (TPR) repeat protein